MEYSRQVENKQEMSQLSRNAIQFVYSLGDAFGSAYEKMQQEDCDGAIRKIGTLNNLLDKLDGVEMQQIRSLNLARCDGTMAWWVIDELERAINRGEAKVHSPTGDYKMELSELVRVYKLRDRLGAEE